MSVESPAGFEEAVSGADGGVLGLVGSEAEIEIDIGNFLFYTE